jgi:transcriptional regulator with XRE-family HTH domain
MHDNDPGELPEHNVDLVDDGDDRDEQEAISGQGHDRLSDTVTDFLRLEPLSERARSLGSFIREQRRVARLSLRKLSDMAEISNPYLSQIERGLRKPSAEILQQLARALRISAETLYVQAGILDERVESPDLARAIWNEPTLSEAQKRALVQVLRSFQAENQ